MENWANDSVFYHIYPLGFCGAPASNDFFSAPQNRLGAVKGFIGHLRSLGISALYLGPVFESSSHGYDTANYSLVDRRLGTNGDLAALCSALHEAGIRVVLDAVFNHVGRDFGPFADVRRNGEHSPFRDWFFLDFSRQSPYHDGFWYEGWEGHFELVKLNLQNPAVVEFLLSVVEGWIRDFQIDGLRLDVAYQLDRNFLHRLCAHCRSLKPGFWLMGEMIHGDYNAIVNAEMLDSCTNYECYKGLYSSMNSQNLFEIAHSLSRQFGSEPWCLYTGKHLYNFVENHDVTRIASLLEEKALLPVIYTLLFCMPGIPSVYYGGEWAIPGDKKEGDDALRPPLSKCQQGDLPLTAHIRRLAALRRELPALRAGGYRPLLIQNQQFVFARETSGQRVIAGFNIAGEEARVHVDAGAQSAENLLGGPCLSFAGETLLPPRSSFVCRIEA